MDVAEAVAELSERGVARFLCTAIEVDGTMEGPALDELNRIAAATAGPGDRLRRRRRPLRTSKPSPSWRRAPNIEGAIVGRALYERSFTVAEAHRRPGRR